jgi:DNA-binding NtrC family response regulator
MPIHPPVVLIVDDSTDTLEMYEIGLSAANCRALKATSIETALNQISEGHPDVVVTDLTLAGRQDGWALIQAIRANDGTSPMPIVVLTGQTHPSIAVRAHDLGCAAVLEKPCLPDTLAETVERIFSGRSLAGAARSNGRIS